MHGPKSIRTSEFDYKFASDTKGSKALTPFVKRVAGFYNKKTADPFTSLNGIGYKEDPYERK